MKQCSKCKVYLNLDQFWKHNTSKDGLRSDCIACVQASRKVTRRGMANHVNKRYGITLEEYDRRRADCTGCAICGVLKNKMDLDHNDKTGVVRDFLCPQHNKGLGLFGEDPELLRAAANYLEAHRDN